MPELEAAVAELEEPPIVIDTDIEDGDLDVSVRILSPVEQEPEALLDAASGAISGAFEPDITADPEPPDASQPAAAPTAEDTLDTNVGIRVLSPGRNGLIDQASAFLEEEPAEPSPDAAPLDGPKPASAAGQRAEPAEEAPQYQDDNAQYQSEGIAQGDPWIWEWYLSLDCSGNVTSTSSEIGSPNSSDWDWNWTWDWTCGLDGASEKSGDALQKGLASVASVSPPGGGTNAAASKQPEPDASAAPWLWTWTFDFCGRETTFSIQAGEQTSLEWTWGWTWAWACTSAEAVSQAPGGEGTSGTAAETSAPSGVLVLPPTLAIVAQQPLLSETLFAAPPTVGPIVVEAPMSIAPVIPLGLTVPSGPGPEPAPASGPGRSPAPAPVPPIATAPVALDIATASPDTPRREHARPTKTRDRDAAPRPARRLPQLPLGPTRRAAGSSSSSGGAAPGSGGATGVAALTGFYVLAAPGLGRRIRDVRELSPHTRAEAPRDRPG